MTKRALRNVQYTTFMGRQHLMGSQDNSLSDILKISNGTNSNIFKLLKLIFMHDFKIPYIFAYKQAHLFLAYKSLVCTPRAGVLDQCLSIKMTEIKKKMNDVFCLVVCELTYSCF